MENKKYDTFGTFSKSNIKLEEWDQTDNPTTDKFMTTQPISTTQDYSNLLILSIHIHQDRLWI